MRGLLNDNSLALISNLHRAKEIHSRRFHGSAGHTIHASHVLVLHNMNDLRHPGHVVPTAEEASEDEIIAGPRQYV